MSSKYTAFKTESNKEGNLSVSEIKPININWFNAISDARMKEIDEEYESLKKYRILEFGGAKIKVSEPRDVKDEFMQELKHEVYHRHNFFLSRIGVIGIGATEDIAYRAHKRRLAELERIKSLFITLLCLNLLKLN